MPRDWLDDKQKTKKVPSRYVAAALGIFFGGIGVHKFYIGETNTGLVFLLCTLLLCWTIVVPLVFSAIGLCQGLSYLFWKEDDWQKRF